MKKTIHNITIFIFLLFMMGMGFASNPSKKTIHLPVKPGIEVLFKKHMDLIRGKRVGLITNPTSINSDLKTDLEVFRTHPEIKLVALYGPEHGVRGNTQAGERVASYFDTDYQLPVYSLYGQSQNVSTNVLENIDQRMRSFDTKHTDKKLKPHMLRSIDVMVFDLQEVGTRIDTYIATMAYAMQTCADAGIPVIVLDRPNPINGIEIEGPILEYPKYSSFIGIYPIPIRHGMTIGELAKLFNEKFLPRKANLTVVKIENWQRNEWYDETKFPWVQPSPNLPTLESVTVYPGQVMLEGTNLSEGRGTTKPFEIFGAPWINGYVLTKKLNALHLPGVKFREVWFTPTFSKYKGTLCSGSQLHITDRAVYHPVATSLMILSTVKNLYEGKLKFHNDYFDHVLGTKEVREALERNEPADKIVTHFQQRLAPFIKMREQFLLY